METHRFLPDAARRVMPAPVRQARPARAAKLGEPLRDLLVDTALLAASRGEDDAAASIRVVLIALGLDQMRLDIAVAMIKLRRGDAQGCVSVLEREVLSREPDHEVALAVQACAWRALGRGDWRLQTHALLATSSHPLAREVARSAL